VTTKSRKIQIVSLNVFLTSRGGDRGEIVGLPAADFHGCRHDFKSALQTYGLYSGRHGRRGDFKRKNIFFFIKF
jgi:hypothetical protein